MNAAYLFEIKLSAEGQTSGGKCFARALYQGYASIETHRILINPNIDYRSAGAGGAKLCFRGPLAEFVSFPFNYFSLVFGKIGLDVNGLGE